MLDTRMRNLKQILSLLELNGVGAAGAGAAGSVSPYQEVTKKGMRYKQPAPTEFSWVAYKGGKEIDKGYMDATDLTSAKAMAQRSGIAIGADSIKVIGRDAKVLSTLDLTKEYIDGIIDRKMNESAFTPVVGRPLQKTDSLVGMYALAGLTKEGTLDVVVSNSDIVIGQEHYKFRLANYDRIGRTPKLPKKFRGKTLDYNSFIDLMKAQFQPKRIGTITLK